MSELNDALSLVLEKPAPVAELRWYEFDQNNSGGSFRLPAQRVLIQAVSHEEAIRLAESEGLYWNGCEQGLDCSCCGDRWYPGWNEEGAEEPFPVGTEKGGMQKNVLCDELPEKGQRYTRFITQPRTEPWTREEVDGLGSRTGKKVMLRAHNGGKAYCAVIRYFDRVDWGF